MSLQKMLLWRHSNPIFVATLAGGELAEAAGGFPSR